MKSLTSWKVYKATSNAGVTKTMLVGFDPSINHGIVEEVSSFEKGSINEYKLFGGHNHYFEGAEQLWMDWRTANDINSITDISTEYE